MGMSVVNTMTTRLKKMFAMALGGSIILLLLVWNSSLNDMQRRTGLPFTHMTSPMPEHFRRTANPPRGVANRRAALNWIHDNYKSGVVYFGDDDNTFDLRLFEEIRSTKRVSMFPVGLIGEYGVSSPVINNGKVIGFFDSWPAKRLWPVDMAGFAINLQFLKRNATMPFKAGFEEDQFLKNNNISLEDIEPKASNCTEILVWHTQSRKKKVAKLVVNVKNLEPTLLHSNLVTLIKEVTQHGTGSITLSKGVIPVITKGGRTKPL